ncbi:hypothetical protein BaRGS_00019732 [Batillaria attramentaria]|uniref:Uncharacterized protein n=1 Tax=Batillaria attramentaria TaxID=370345 RepID=A0ABD0KPB8_9CAEN
MKSHAKLHSNPVSEGNPDIYPSSAALLFSVFRTEDCQLQCHLPVPMMKPPSGSRVRSDWLNDQPTVWMRNNLRTTY